MFTAVQGATTAHHRTLTSESHFAALLSTLSEAADRAESLVVVPGAAFAAVVADTFPISNGSIRHFRLCRLVRESLGRLHEIGRAALKA
jgi:hypothetical protein